MTQRHEVDIDVNVRGAEQSQQQVQGTTGALDELRGATNNAAFSFVRGTILAGIFGISLASLGRGAFGLFRNTAVGTNALNQLNGALHTLVSDISNEIEPEINSLTNSFGRLINAARHPTILDIIRGQARNAADTGESIATGLETVLGEEGQPTLGDALRSAPAFIRASLPGYRGTGPSGSIINFGTVVSSNPNERYVPETNR